MAVAKGCKLVKVNVPFADHDKLKARAEDAGKPVTAIILKDIHDGQYRHETKQG